MATDDPFNTEDQQVEQIMAAASESVPRFVADLVTEGGERSAVIVGAAQLDTVLERFLITVLQPGNDKTLFAVNSPLGSAYSKIVIAHRIGIIDDDVAGALELVNRIRNAFAHSLETATLTEGKQRDRLDELVKLCEGNAVYPGVRRGFTDLLKREDLAEEAERGQFSDALLDFASVMSALLIALISVTAISDRVQPSHRAFLDFS